MNESHRPNLMDGNPEAPRDDGPRILRRARFAEEPLPRPQEARRAGSPTPGRGPGQAGTEEDTDRTHSSKARRQLLAALKGPRLPRALKARRTRFVNADPDVAVRRAAAVAQIANTYPDPMIALRSMEKRIMAGMAAGEVARVAAVNPGAFGKWYGAARPDASHHHRPDRDALGGALARLAEAVDAAGREAARRWPTHAASGARRQGQAVEESQ